MEIREAMAADIDGILDLVNGVFCRSNNKPETMGSQFPYLFSEKNAENLFVAVDNGKIVSHVGFLPWKAVIEGIPVKLASIGSVATDAEHRKLGLGTKLLHLALEKMKAMETDIILVSGARGLYKRNGYYSVGKSTYFVSNKTTEAKTGDYRLKHVAFSESIAEILVDIESKEKTRFVRTADELKTLYEAAGYCRIFPWRQELYLIEKAGKNVAYFIVGHGAENAKVIEYHGERQAVAIGVNALANENDVDIHIPVLAYDKRLLVHLTELGFVEQKTETYPGTIKLVNPLLFWTKFQTYLIDSDANTDLLEIGNGEGYQFFVGGNLEWEGNEEAFAEWMFSRLSLPWPNGLNYI